MEQNRLVMPAFPDQENPRARCFQFFIFCDNFVDVFNYALFICEAPNTILSSRVFIIFFLKG